MKEPKKKLLLVEDNPTTSRTLVLFLEAGGYEVRCAFGGREALERFSAERFDVVVLDLMLPDLDGLQVCDEIRALSDVAIVMLTARTTDEEVVAGLERGADDYVCKPFSAKVLLARVNRSAKRADRSPAADAWLQVGDLKIDEQRRKASLAGASLKLTRSEFDILVALARQPGRVFTRQQLIEKALGADFDGFDRTIDTHIWSLRKKLKEPRGRPRYIESEAGIGYRMSDPDAD